MLPATAGCDRVARSCSGLALGTVGSVVIEGYPVFDAFYMTLTYL